MSDDEPDRLIVGASGAVLAGLFAQFVLAAGVLVALSEICHPLDKRRGAWDQQDSQ